MATSRRSPNSSRWPNATARGSSSTMRTASACSAARRAARSRPLRSPHLVYVGTLGKAAGVAGAFVIAHETVIEWMIQRARSYIFTTAAPPAVAHAVSASLKVIAGDEGDARRAHLAALIDARARCCATRAGSRSIRTRPCSRS